MKNNQPLQAAHHANHDSAAPRQHPLICTGMETIHQVHGSPKPRAGGDAPNEDHISTIFPQLHIWSSSMPRGSQKVRKLLCVAYDFPKAGTLDMSKRNFRNLGIFSFGHGQFYCKGPQELALKLVQSRYCGKAPTLKPQLSCLIRRPFLKATIGRVRDHTRLSLSVKIPLIPCIALCLFSLCRIAT